MIAIAAARNGHDGRRRGLFRAALHEYAVATSIPSAN